MSFGEDQRRIRRGCGDVAARCGGDAKYGDGLADRAKRAGGGKRGPAQAGFLGCGGSDGGVCSGRGRGSVGEEEGQSREHVVIGWRVSFNEKQLRAIEHLIRKEEP
jgi:hypothetical protein